jgi:hypothetical protein
MKQPGHSASLCDSITSSTRIRFSVHTGVKFGRKLKLSSFQIEEAKRRREAGESHSDIARLFGVSHRTIGML